MAWLYVCPIQARAAFRPQRGGSHPLPHTVQQNHSIAAAGLPASSTAHYHCITTVPRGTASHCNKQPAALRHAVGCCCCCRQGCAARTASAVLCTHKLAVRLLQLLLLTAWPQLTCKDQHKDAASSNNSERCYCCCLLSGCAKHTMPLHHCSCMHTLQQQRLTEAAARCTKQFSSRRTWWLPRSCLRLAALWHHLPVRP